MRLALATLALSFMVPALPVFAQATPAANETRPAASEYVLKVQDAVRRAKDRNYEAAFEVLREAFQMEPSNPMAFYFAGEIDRMQNNLPQAMERFRTCLQFAGSEDNDRYHARCMQAMAETLERTEGQLEASREAWDSYVQFADGHRQVSHPEIGRERQSAINAQLEQAAAYVAVRQRIAQREQENAANPPQQQRQRQRRLARPAH